MRCLACTGAIKTEGVQLKQCRPGAPDCTDVTCSYSQHMSLTMLPAVDKPCCLHQYASYVAQVQKKIVDELREHGLLATPEQPQPRAPDYNDLDKLTYLSCVIKEAMRTHTVSSLPFATYQQLHSHWSLCWMSH